MESFEAPEVAEISNSGHYVAEESPDDFVDKCLAFTTKHQPRMTWPNPERPLVNIVRV
jgi:hypothetical protein